MDTFARIVQNTGFNQINHAVRDQFGMNTEVFFIIQIFEHGIWDGADTELHRGTIGDQFGYMSGNLFHLFIVAF